MRKKLLYSLIGILVVAFGGLLLTVVGGDSPSLGLDLQGGISITQKPVGDFNTSSLDLAVDRIRERVDSLGVAEPEICVKATPSSSTSPVSRTRRRQRSWSR